MVDAVGNERGLRGSGVRGGMYSLEKEATPVKIPREQPELDLPVLEIPYGGCIRVTVGPIRS